jgi:hypothetical protein
MGLQLALGFVAGEPGRGVAGGASGAGSGLVALRIGLALAVVQRTQHHGPVNVQTPTRP